MNFENKSDYELVVYIEEMSDKLIQAEVELSKWTKEKLDRKADLYNLVGEIERRLFARANLILENKKLKEEVESLATKQYPDFDDPPDPILIDPSIRFREDDDLPF